MEKQKEEKLNQDSGEDEDIEKLKKERDEYLDGWKRAKADFINYQKDEMKRFEEMIKYSNEMILKDLIAVLDSFELALSAEAATKAEGISRGWYMIKSQLEEILRKQGLEKIKVSPGDVFDPSRHESVGEVAGSPVGGESGKIAEEIESGYILNGKVVRPVRVKITK